MRKLHSFIPVFLFLLPSFSFAKNDVIFTRIAGDNRYETASKLCKKHTKPLRMSS